jgi:hypothetical protein
LYFTTHSKHWLLYKNTKICRPSTRDFPAGEVEL